MEKLIRHHLPDQIRARGEKCETRIASPEEMLGLLKDKFKEEIDELFEAIGRRADRADAAGEAAHKDSLQIAEELADVYEVLGALEDHLGSAIALRRLTRQREKRDEKGRFTNIVMQLDPSVPMVLHCPKCKIKHIDRGIWGTTRIHRTHLCSGAIWRPFDFATVGVEVEAVKP